MRKFSKNRILRRRKKTYRNSIRKKGIYPGIELKFAYLSSDELRNEYPDKKDNHIAIFQEMHRRTLKCIDSGLNVIYDSTNLEAKYRKDLFAKVKKHNKKTIVYAVFIYNGIKSAIDRSHKRSGRSDVNDELIIQMYQTMQIPTIGTECDMIIVPEIKFKDNRYQIIDNKIFRKNNFCDFLNYVGQYDEKLVTKYKKERIKEDRYER